MPALCLLLLSALGCHDPVATRPPVEEPEPEPASVSLSEAHELRDLVCSWEAPVSWWLDGEPWTGELESSAFEGDTVPFRVLEAGQSWRCADAEEPEAEGHSAEASVAPYHHDFLLEPLQPLPGETATLRYRGQREGPLTVWVAFDGWELQGEATPFEHRSVEEKPFFYAQVELVEGQAELEIPEDVRAVHLLIVEDGQDPPLHEEQLWGLSEPAMGPWLTVDPGGGLALHFALTARGPATARVQWEGGELEFQSEGQDSVHHIRLVGVPAETELSYSITDAIGREVGPWSTHRVPPDADGLVVLAASDMQDDGTSLQRWGRVAEGMLEHSPDADLLVLPGDLAADDYPGCWWLFFDRGRELFASVPMLIAVGNHDTPHRASDPDTSSVLRLFDPRGDGPGPEVAAVDYGPLRVLLLNSELPDEFATEGAQAQWVQSQLPSESAFTIAAWHRPAYDVGRRFADEQALFRELTALFDGQVDLVFMGHEHIYQRFESMLYEAELDESGVPWIVLPAAGNNGQFSSLIAEDEPFGSLREALAEPQLEPGQIQVDLWHGYSELRLEGERLELLTWEVGEEEVVARDGFLVERP